MKRTIFLFVTILVLVAGWSAAWFFVEGKVVETTQTIKQRLADRGQLLECYDQAIGGYPFRISVDCSSVSYLNERSGVAFEAGALRSGAQAYQPGKVVVELDSPGKIETRHGGNFDVNWSSLRGSANFELSGRERTSLIGKELELLPKQDPSKVTISSFEYHDRRSQENDLDIAISLMDLKEVSSTSLELIDFDLRSELTFFDVHRDYSRGRNLMDLIRQRGIKGDLQRLAIAAENGAEVTLSGPFDSDNNGLLNGKIKVEVKDLDALMRLLIFFNPGQEKVIAGAVQSIKLLAPADENGVRSVTITIKKNVLNLGFIPIGRLPNWL